MDGGGRLLQSVKGVGGGFLAPSVALAGTSGVFDFREGVSNRAARRARSVGTPAPRANIFAVLAAEFFLTVGLLGGVGFYGAVKGGEYSAFVAANGSLIDIAAKMVGFGIKAVTIVGEHELDEHEILEGAGISPRNSLVFLDVAEIRERLKQIPLVKEASVSKLYPDRLVIEIEERHPSALWQKNGEVQIVAADGMPLDRLRDNRFIGLPFVVGEAANDHLSEYMAIRDQLGDLKDRISAGIYVSQRRWSLKASNGVEIDLPETGVEAAVATLVQLQRDSRILDKDVLSLDLRQPGRVVARLTADAANARAEMLARKVKPKGGQT